MKLLAINGSPRKDRNTARLLGKIVEGAASKGAESELVHLKELQFTGCVSCFECKRIGGRSYGMCAIADGASELLSKAEAADVLVLGSPVYFGMETSLMRAFMERLFFSSMLYKKEDRYLSKRKKGTALVYTMNVPQDVMAAYGYDRVITAAKERMGAFYGSCELLLACDTKQFDDYGKYDAEIFDGADKLKRHETVFPQELRLALELGQNLVS